jgi:hypothetical protein
MESQSALIARCVEPFYLDLMRTNAVEHGDTIVGAVAGVGRATEAEDVIRLLGYAWRERVMGAWLALFSGTSAVRGAVLDALATSHGALDAPPLATAAVVLAGPDALGALVQYHAADKANEWGAADLIAAAGRHLAEELGAANRLPPPSEEARETFRKLLDFASRLQAA